jgi:hypothetical protein
VAEEDVGEWTPAFPGQRPPFERGNSLPVTHGAYSSVLKSAPRVREIADEQRAVAPHLQPADEAMLQVFALGIARLELMSAVVLAAPGEEGADVEEWAERVERNVRLSADARGWMRETVRLAYQLGLTPAGRAEIEERERTVIFVEEAQELFTALFAAAAAFIPAELREAFLEKVDEARRALPIERPALEAGPPVDEAGGSTDAA